MPFKKKINTIMEMQRAEIERLQLSNESLNEIIGDLLDDWSSAIEKAKIKAIKEFAQLLVDKSSNGIIYAMDLPEHILAFETEASER